MSGNTPAPTIDLAKPRVLSFKERGITYTFTFAPISKEQWRKYFSAIVSTSETKGQETIKTFDTSSAKLGLVRSALISASGYKLPAGREITEIEGWQDKLPSSHRLALGDLLVSTARVMPLQVEGEDTPVEVSLGEELVEIESVWTVGENGINQKVGRLMHYLDTPSPDQQRRYARDSSRSVILGNSRTGTTQWLGSQMTLAAIYDELVVRVEGYSFNGEPLQGREHIASSMDTFHKVVAAYKLFAPVEMNAE